MSQGGLEACPCVICRARPSGADPREALRRQVAAEARRIQEHGYVVHALTDRPYAHTHGLAKNYGQTDLEVRLAASPEKRAELLQHLAEAVKAGARFSPVDADRTVFTVPVRFVRSIESRRVVLRAVFPDPDGRWPEEPLCQEGYRDQMANRCGEQTEEEVSAVGGLLLGLPPEDVRRRARGQRPS